MKAWYIISYGGPDKLQCGELPEPELGPSDLLVRIHAASINPLDWLMRSGGTRVVLKHVFPLILGNDMAGVVESVGAEVTGFQPGDRVYARPDKRRIGTLAERIAIAADDVALMPAGLGFEEAAALPLVSLTAWQVLVDLAGTNPGNKVLIHAGAGGVGTIAIQLANHLGAHVATTASAPKHDLLRELGADEVVDYRHEDFSERLSDFDFVFDTVGGDTQKRSFSILKPGGLLVSIVAPPDLEFAREWGLGWPLQVAVRLMSAPVRRRARRHHCRYRFLIMHASGEQLSRITRLVEEGVIRPVIDRVFPFEEADQAMTYAEQGHATGKVIVRCEGAY